MEAWLEHFAHANFHRSADTAHDLKTPLNVAVLNLELLRMRLQKIDAARDDQKLATYAQAIEGELRRLGRIFDAFFLLTSPPVSEGSPTSVDLGVLAAEAAAAAGLSLARESVILECAHESRIRHALKLFIEGTSKLLQPGDRQVSAERSGAAYTLEMAGSPLPGIELSKVFKFYYNDQDGNPDLSLAVARLIAETYGGELNAEEDRDKVSVRLSFPLGA